MKSPVVKRSIVLSGHKTSVSLEEAFWKGLKDIAMWRHQTLSDLVGSIDAERKHGNLSSAIRLFVLNHYQAHSSGEHIVKSGHEPAYLIDRFGSRIIAAATVPAARRCSPPSGGPHRVSNGLWPSAVRLGAASGYR
jgi:predicted DNA-binding ribbon-helix-helix protein